MLVLGIETSCDETSAAVVRDGRYVLSNVVLSQIDQHRPYGGVVPELACRAHVETLPGIIEEAMLLAGSAWSDIDLIAATRGPGLASSLLVGVSAAKGLALSLDKPLAGVNHLEGHLASVFLGAEGPDLEAACPCLVLLVSGGHTALVHMKAWGTYRLIGRTLDDAAGEALDKGATLMGLGYPGGPAIEKAAAAGNAAAVAFPRGLMHEKGFIKGTRLEARACFSFSGLKTSLRYYLAKHPEAAGPSRLPDVAASYQAAVVEALLSRIEYGLQEMPAASFACVGGVARNALLRRRLDDLSGKYGVPLLLAKPEYCTDNAAMIAGAAARNPMPEIPFENFDVNPGLGFD